MKKLFKYALMATAIVVCGACTDDDLSDGTNNEDITSANFHTVVFEAGMDGNGSNGNTGKKIPGTKTTIVTSGNGYLVKWSPGDVIDIFECAYGVPIDEEGHKEDRATTYKSQELTAGSIGESGKALFKVDLDNKNAGGTHYEYYAVYPHASRADGDPYDNMIYTDKTWSSSSDDSYRYWDEEWGYTGPYVESHPIIQVYLPNLQSPTADSFDPKADIMASKAIKYQTQLMEIQSLTFARFGSILKITVKGLDAYKGYSIQEARVSFDDSFGANMVGEYDPAIGQMKYYKGVPYFGLTPENVTIKEDGTADLWIRSYNGEIKNWFRVDLTMSQGEKGEPVKLSRYVDLNAAGKTIKLNEGGMTTFSVKDFAVADVENVETNNIIKSVKYERNGFDVIWKGVENASGYECYYCKQIGDWTYSDNVSVACTSSGAEDNMWGATVTGLEPGIYQFKIRPIPAAGHCLINSGEEAFSNVTLYVGVEKEDYFSLYDIPDGKYETESEFTSNNITIKMTNVESIYNRAKGQFLRVSDNKHYNIHTTSVPLSEVTKVVLKVEVGSDNNIIDKILTESSHFYATKIAGDLSDKVEITPTIVANSDGSSFNVTYEMPKGYKYFYLKGYLYNSGLANDDATRWPLDIYRIYIYGYE